MPDLQYAEREIHARKVGVVTTLFVFHFFPFLSFLEINTLANRSVGKDLVRKEMKRGGG